MSTTPSPTPRAWLVLALGVLAQMAATVVIAGPAFLIPYMHGELGFTLTQAGTVGAASSFGLLATLIAWGAFADRFGECLAIVLGLVLSALVMALGLVLPSGVWAATLTVVLGGAAAASVNSASGRVVIGWFPRHRRGLAMGIRQMSQPLGTGLAALVVPPVAAAWGFAGFYTFALACTAVMAVACFLGVRNPPRPARSAEAAASNPYLADSFLWRVHGASALLVVHQFAFSTYGLVWLMLNQGMDAALAGVVVATAQVIGAVGRMVIGGVSDKVGSRVRMIRWTAVTAVVTVLGMALVSLHPMPVVASLVFIVASTVSVADNGLEFAAVAEAAGPAWSGKALGAQNTGQFLVAGFVGPGFGALVTAVGYGATFGLVALAPLASIALVPRKDVDREPELVG